MFSAKPARSCTNPSISPKTWHGPRFPRQIGADLCGPEHLAKKPFPQSTVFSAKQARTCADPSLQTRNLPRTTVLSAKQARTCADPSLQTRNLPRTTVLSAKQARTLLRAFGNYKGYNRNIPQLKQQAQHSVSLSCTKLSHLCERTHLHCTAEPKLQGYTVEETQLSMSFTKEEEDTIQAAKLCQDCQTALKRSFESSRARTYRSPGPKGETSLPDYGPRT